MGDRRRGGGHGDAGGGDGDGVGYMKEMTVAEHPGGFIREEMDARGWNGADLAFVLGFRADMVSRLLNGKHGVSPAMSKKLAAAFGTSADHWRSLQIKYDLSRAAPPKEGVRERAAFPEGRLARSP